MREADRTQEEDRTIARRQNHCTSAVLFEQRFKRQCQNHYYFCIGLQFRCTRSITLNDVANSVRRRTAAGRQYALFYAGPLASNGIAASAFARSDARLSRPDLQLTLSAWSFAGRDRAGVHPHPGSGFSISSVHLHPDAHADVRLKSPDPLAASSIRFNFSRALYDLQALSTGMRLTRTITQRPALAPYVADELFPGSSVNAAPSRARCRTFARCRRIDHAVRPHGKHQCPHDHDR